MKYLIFILALVLYSCSNQEQVATSPEEETTEKITSNNKQEALTIKKLGSPLKEGKLVVLLDNSMASFFVYRGQLFGFEYEMLKTICNDLDLELVIKIIKDKDHILDSLVAGHGHMAAANLTRNKNRLNNVDFTYPIFRTKQVLVQKKPDNWRKIKPHILEKMLIRDAIDLDGQKISVRAKTSFADRLQNYSNETGIELTIDTLPGDIQTEHAMEMVANKEIKFTIADKNVASVYSRFFPGLDISTPLSLSQSIAWAVSMDYPELTEALDLWLSKNKGSLVYNMIYNKYFSPNKRKNVFNKSEYEQVQKGVISPYDPLIKKYAKKIDWDWRLLAAQINKESQFDPKQTSWAGAKGLMQVMPATGREHGGIKDLHDPELGVKAGTNYLLWLEKYWQDEIHDKDELEKIVLASYNVGPGHVRDAMRLCDKYDLNKHVWYGNVEVMVLNKSKPSYYNDPVVRFGYCRGKEPTEYVRDILANYEFYKSYLK